MANTFYTNVFRTQENVNKDNMNYTVADKDQKLSAFFPMPIANSNGILPGVICTGIGTIDNQFGFNSTTNQFLLNAGVLRFPDAISNNTPYSITNQTATISQFLELAQPNPQPSLTTPLVANPYYLIATLQVNGNGSSYQYTNTAPVIPYTIIATSLFTGINQIALCLITISGSNVTISTDINCAVNYGTKPSIFFQQGRLNGIGSANSPTAPYDDTSQTGSPTLYFTPTEQGNLISTYNATNNDWETQSFTELSLGVSQLVELSASPVGGLVSISTSNTQTAPYGIAISPDIAGQPRNVYVANNASNTISQYRRNSNGTLTEIGSPVPTRSGLTRIIVSPDGTNVYVTLFNVFALVQYNRDSSTGLLVYVRDAPTEFNPWGVAITSDGNYAYCTNNGGNGSITQYSRDGNGTLTVIGSPAQTRANPTEIIVSPNNSYVYVVNNGDSSMGFYTIQSNGTLSGLQYFATGSATNGIAISPDGNYVYVTNYGSNSVSQYSVSSSGQPTNLVTYTGINTPVGIIVSPDGKNVYITSNTGGFIYEYNRNTSNGTLSYFDSVGSGSGARELVMSSNGKNVYIANFFGNTVSAYSRTQPQAPTVSLTTPSSTSNVSLSTPIIITFSEQVIGVNTNTVQFQTQGGSLQTITVSDSGNNTYTITGQTLVNATTYLVIINSGITSVATGIGVASRQFTFTTIPTGPTVQLTSPTNRTDVSITTPITLTFSVAVTNVTTTTINFKAIGGLPQNISITNSGNNVYTVNLPSSLSLSTNYVVEVLQGITGTGQGSPAVVPINFYFSTTFPATVKYDIFVGNNSSNVLTLAKDQFSDSTGTNRQQLANGKWVNAHTIITPSGNNIPPNQGLLVGSVALYNGLVQSWTGNRSIWNLYNQISKALVANAGSIDPTSSSNQGYLWSYPNSTTSNNFRNQNGNNSNGTGRLSFILDLLYNKGLVLLYNGSGVSGLGSNTGITGITANTDLGDGTIPPTSAIQLLSFAIYGNDPATSTSTTNNWHTLSYLYNYNSSILSTVSNISVGFNFIQKIEKTFTTGYFSDTGGGLSTEFWG